jgi:hypothetical protein
MTAHNRSDPWSAFPDKPPGDKRVPESVKRKTHEREDSVHFVAAVATAEFACKAHP